MSFAGMIYAIPLYVYHALMVVSWQSNGQSQETCQQYCCNFLLMLAKYSQVLLWLETSLCSQDTGIEWQSEHGSDLVNIPETSYPSYTSCFVHYSSSLRSFAGITKSLLSVRSMPANCLPEGQILLTTWCINSLKDLALKEILNMTI